MFKHILVPTDGSHLSAEAIAHAVRFAKETGATLTFLYVRSETPSMYLGLGAISHPHALQEAKERLDAAGAEILSDASSIASLAGLRHEVLMKKGDAPFACIIDAAIDQGCDLIFMASHGHAGIKSALLGSETQKVLTHSKIPVLVYRSQRTPTPAACVHNLITTTGE